MHTKDNTILFLGDSLTEGFGVSKEDAFPKLVETLIKAELKESIIVINGGVSGSITSDGLSVRIPKNYTTHNFIIKK